MRALAWFLGAVILVGCGGASESEKQKGNHEEKGGEGGSGNSAGKPPFAGGPQDEDGPGEGGRGGPDEDPRDVAGAGGTAPVTPVAGGWGPVAGGGWGPVAGGGWGPPIFGGGSSGPPPEELPPALGCTPNSQATGPGYCNIGYACENSVYVGIDCGDQGNGNWLCGCRGNGYYVEYTIQGQTGMGACETIGDVCVSGQPEFSGEEQCSPLATSQAVDSCSLQEQCVRPLASPEGASLIIGGQNVQCYANGTETASCYCSNTGRQYDLKPVKPSEACGAAKDLCREEPGFEKPTCEVETALASSSGSFGAALSPAPPAACDKTLRCTESVEVSSGLSASRTFYRRGRCSEQPNGSTWCDCAEDNVARGVELVGPASAESCDTALSFCENPEALTLSGSPECERTSQNAGPSYCYSTLECVQSGKFGGSDARVRGNVQTNCEGTAAGLSCTCWSGQTQVTTTIEKSGSAWEDCTAATEKCRELVKLDLGNGSGFGAGGVGGFIGVGFASGGRNL